MKKRIASLFMAIAMIASLGVNAMALDPVTITTSGVQKFDDVPTTHWAFAYVDKVTAAGMFHGLTPTWFGPSDNMTRAQFVTVLARMEGQGALESVPTDTKFSDVDRNYRFAGPIAWATNTGIVEGYSDGTFRPTQAISRAQFAAMIHRYINYKKYDQTLANGKVISLKVVSPEPAQFPDYSQVSDVFKADVDYARVHGLVQGFGDGTLRPNIAINRAQIAAILARFIDVLVDSGYLPFLDGSDTRNPIVISNSTPIYSGGGGSGGGRKTTNRTVAITLHEEDTNTDVAAADFGNWLSALTVNDKDAMSGTATHAATLDTTLAFTPKGGKEVTKVEYTYSGTNGSETGDELSDGSVTIPAPASASNHTANVTIYVKTAFEVPPQEERQIAFVGKMADDSEFTYDVGYARIDYSTTGSDGMVTTSEELKSADAKTITVEEGAVDVTVTPVAASKLYGLKNIEGVYTNYDAEADDVTKRFTINDVEVKITTAELMKDDYADTTLTVVAVFEELEYGYALTASGGQDGTALSASVTTSPGWYSDADDEDDLVLLGPDKLFLESMKMLYNEPANRGWLTTALEYALDEALGKEYSVDPSSVPGAEDMIASQIPSIVNGVAGATLRDMLANPKASSSPAALRNAVTDAENTARTKAADALFPNASAAVLSEVQGNLRSGMTARIVGTQFVNSTGGAIAQPTVTPEITVSVASMPASTFTVEDGYQVKPVLLVDTTTTQADGIVALTVADVTIDENHPIVVKTDMSKVSLNVDAKITIDVPAGLSVAYEVVNDSTGAVIQTGYQDVSDQIPTSLDKATLIRDYGVSASDFTVDTSTVKVDDQTITSLTPSQKEQLKNIDLNSVVIDMLNSDDTEGLNVDRTVNDKVFAKVVTALTNNGKYSGAVKSDLDALQETVKLENFLADQDGKLILKMKNGEEYRQYAAARYEQGIEFLKAIVNACADEAEAEKVLLDVLGAFTGRQTPLIKAFSQTLSKNKGEPTMLDFDKALKANGLMDTEAPVDGKSGDLGNTVTKERVENKINNPASRLYVIMGVLYEDEDPTKPVGIDVLTPYFAQLNLYRFAN